MAEQSGNITRRGFLAGAGGVALAAAAGSVLATGLPRALGGATPASAAATISRWGVCGHAPSEDSTSYPQATLADQLALVQSLGATDYRVDWYVPKTTDAGAVDWTWYDDVVSTTLGMGMELLPVLTLTGRADGSIDPDDDWPDRVAMLTARYKGRIPYYQVQNERDTDAIKGPQVDGISTTDYTDAAFDPVLATMTAVQNGVRAGDAHARTVVNITWKHTGFLQRLNDAGFGHDVNGLDWYYGADDMLSVLSTMDAMPQAEILITELDVDGGTASASEADQASYISSTVDVLRTSAPAKVHGVYVYELLDQPDRDSDGQRHYGLVDVAADGTIGAHKQAFDTYHSIIAG
jgi:hypothetical protein